MSGQHKVTKARIVEAIISREEKRNGYFKECVTQIGKYATLELEQLYSVYDERLYIWLATLWDPKIGGFYFSSSGRDCDAFLPDIESTVQALRFIQNSGLLSHYGKQFGTSIPAPMREALLSFAKGLQDPDDGFFYHPQWGKNIVTARRSRDLSWAMDLIGGFGDKPNYPTPIDEGELGAERLPDYLRDVDKWRKYLEDFDLLNKSSFAGCVISAQAVQIRAAGKEYVDLLCRWLEKEQNPENGLWEKEISYQSVDGMMKMLILYSHFGRPMPNADKAMKSAILASLSDAPISHCPAFFNPVSAMSALLNNVSKHVSSDDADAMRRTVINHAEEIIRATREKVLTCQRRDGSFSYNPERGSKLSQKAPVGLGLEEGDVNASSMCSTGVTYNLCQALGIPVVPIFCEKDSEIFFDIIDNAIQSQKLYVKPRWFDEYIDPNKIKEPY